MQWKFWQRGTTNTDDIMDKPIEPSATGTLLRRVGAVVTGLIILTGAIGWWWDNEPSNFDVRAKALEHATSANQQVVTGYITTTAVIELADTLLSKRGISQASTGAETPSLAPWALRPPRSRSEARDDAAPAQRTRGRTLASPHQHLDSSTCDLWPPRINHHSSPQGEQPARRADCSPCGHK